MNKIKVLIFFLLLIFKTNIANSLIEIDITRGNLNPLPIAVSPLSQDKESLLKSKKTLQLENLGSEISKVIENNFRKK